MRLTRKVVLFPFLFLVVLSVSLSTMVPKAFAVQKGVRAANSQINPVVTLGFQPAIAGVVLPVEASIDTNGTISFGLSAWEIETPLGIVSLSAQVSSSISPQVSLQAQQMSMSGSDLLLIIRHKQGNSLEDANYLLHAQQNIQGIDIRGIITEISVRWTGKNYMVYVDASNGSISGITLQGVPAGTTSTVKIGCPTPIMVAWSMNLNLGSLNEVGGTPCTYQWINSAGGGADQQCPTGYGSTTVQLSFPGWHFWDQGEIYTCDGTTAAIIDDMGIADSATITFQVDAKATNPTPPSSPIMQTCMVILANGLNIRAAPTSQSVLIAHYPSGTILNFVKVVLGENVNGNSLWGLSAQGHYFWLGGTDHPNG